ncbi:hypothetical protein [Shimia sediminis]|uniref:hypothetical protein n=1 Tax=Shimia sediminis TaxID=2497945 RepID=UPI000F8D3981|nr:hypothetical protein [Shimia sediminis]
MPHHLKAECEKTHSFFGVTLLFLGLFSIGAFLIGRYFFGWSRLGFVCHMLVLLAACGLACAPLWLHRTKALGRDRAEKFSRIAVVSLLSTELMFNLFSLGMTKFAGVPVNVWMVVPYVVDPHQAAKVALIAAAIIAGWSTVFLAMWRLWPRVGRFVSSSREPNLSVRLSGMTTVTCLVLIMLIPNRWWQGEEVTKWFSKSSTGDHVPFGISDILSDAQRQKEERYRNQLLFKTARELPVVLITVDALRPDQMGVYDPEKSTTPFLSRQAAQGLLRKYDHAFSVCSASNCGLTGLVKSQAWDNMNVHSLGLMEVLSALDYELTSILSGDHSNFFELRTAYSSEIKTFFDGTMSSDFDLNDDRSVLAKVKLLPPQTNRGNSIIFI